MLPLSGTGGGGGCGEPSCVWVDLSGVLQEMVYTFPGKVGEGVRRPASYRGW